MKDADRQHVITAAVQGLVGHKARLGTELLGKPTVDPARELVHRAAVQPVAPDAREHTPAPFVSGIDVLERGYSGGRDAQAQRADGGRF